MKYAIIILALLTFGYYIYLQESKIPQALIDSWNSESLSAIKLARKNIGGEVVNPPVPEVCESCKGLGYITHGDGHRTKCPKCKVGDAPKNDLQNYTGCVILFGDNCSPCEALKGDIDKLISQKQLKWNANHFKFIKSTTDLVPTIRFYRNGVVYKEVVGYDTSNPSPGYNGPIFQITQDYPR